MKPKGICADCRNYKPASKDEHTHIKAAIRELENEVLREIRECKIYNGLDRVSELSSIIARLKALI